MRGGGGPRRGGIQRASPARRLRVGLLCAGIALSLIAGRLIQLQGLDGARYRALAERQRLHSISVPAERGSITTADGTTLAMTVQTDTVTADPTQIRGGTPARTAALRQQVADALAGPLAMPSATILHLLDYPSSRRYVLLAKGISLSAASQITASLNKLNVVGIYLTPAYTRDLPQAAISPPTWSASPPPRAGATCAGRPASSSPTTRCSRAGTGSRRWRRARTASRSRSPPTGSGPWSRAGT